MTHSTNLGDSSITELFRQEIQTQVAVLTEGLLALERDPSGVERLTDLMRAAHSLKGAGRIVGCEAVVRISHVVEDCLVAAQKKHLAIDTAVDQVLLAVDLLTRIGQKAGPLLDSWVNDHAAEVDAVVSSLEQITKSGNSIKRQAEQSVAALVSPATAAHSTTTDRSLRVTADNLNQLLALAGEGLVASRWLSSFVSETRRLRELANRLERAANDLSDLGSDQTIAARTSHSLGELKRKVIENRSAVTEWVAELDGFDRRFSNLSTRLYQEIVDCRMRPFLDCVQGFPRLVRDLGKSLGKQLTLEIAGEGTLIDRDILELLKAPIDHLLRNAIDHGIEAAQERLSAGKGETAVLRLEACHRAGRLLITVSDDGGGIDVDRLRQTVVERNFTTAELAQTMSERELLEFLFLPGFTLSTVISEISGRGVGLDVVQAMSKSVGGTVTVSSERGKGTQFQMELPLTLSVIRTLVVEIGGEPFAIPLSRIETTLKVPFCDVQLIEGSQNFKFRDEYIGIVGAAELLELGKGHIETELCVVVLGNKAGKYGLVVDRFIGQRELVVRSLDPRLGKLRNISAAALMPDGSPLLIVDVEGLIQEIERSLSTNRIGIVSEESSGGAQHQRKHILVVDDSLTVRELERKMLDAEGYSVDVAMDGMDAWNLIRNGQYDLVLTDVDMPRMDGIELVSLIRKDRRLSTLPVMIVSYKDRAEDKRRGLDAGADYYLTKGSFHDQTLIRAVADLIGATR